MKELEIEPETDNSWCFLVHSYCNAINNITFLAISVIKK